MFALYIILLLARVFLRIIEAEQGCVLRLNFSLCRVHQANLCLLTSHACAVAVHPTRVVIP